MLNVGLIQMDILWMQPDKNIEVIKREIDGSESVPDLLVLPEMFTTAYILQPSNQREIIRQLDKTTEKLIKLSETYHIGITGSTPWLVDDKFYNRCLLIDGTAVSSYDKIHLYTPVGEHLEYTQGNTVVNFLFRGIKIRPLICYDLRFPYLSMMGSSYDLLIYMANWPIPRINHWNTLLKARAIENQCYTIGVNRTGGDNNKIVYNGSSAVHQYDGEEMLHLGESQNMHVVTLDFELQNEYRKKLPFTPDRKEVYIK